jgi:hypothetical protein
LADYLDRSSPGSFPRSLPCYSDCCVAGYLLGHVPNHLTRSLTRYPAGNGDRNPSGCLRDCDPRCPPRRDRSLVPSHGRRSVTSWMPIPVHNPAPASYTTCGIGVRPEPQFCRGVGDPQAAPGVASADTARGTTNPTTAGTSGRTTSRTMTRRTSGTTSRTSCDSTLCIACYSGRDTGRYSGEDTRDDTSEHKVQDTSAGTSQRTPPHTSRDKSATPSRRRSAERTSLHPDPLLKEERESGF